jgi:hypothetical protein
MALKSRDFSSFVGKLLREEEVDVLREGIRVLAQAAGNSPTVPLESVRAVPLAPCSPGHVCGSFTHWWPRTHVEGRTGRCPRWCGAGPGFLWPGTPPYPGRECAGVFG